MEDFAELSQSQVATSSRVRRPPAPVHRRRRWWIVAGLAAVTFIAFLPSLRCGFVNLDDDAYVEFAPMVNQGLRSASIAWAFTAAHSSNWHPLTSMSHMLDCSLFGLRPGPMHAENVLWHILNTLLVFAVWRRLTGAEWRAALVAALFALHPIHVESVAWIAERKDVLSTFFWLLALLAYVRWTARRSLGRYALVVGALTLALLSKPMAVTIPCTLLLLDFWPLRRWPSARWTALVWEKLPLFGLVLAHAVITYLVQSGTGANRYGQRFTFDERVANAFVSYVRYIGKALWPESLAPLYHHPGRWPFLIVVASIAGFATVTVFAWWQRRARPWILWGWLWYIGTLVPVIGLVQVGAQSMADRYSYVPLLGVFTVVVWAGAELAGSVSVRRPALSAALVALGVVLTVFTFRQVRTWTDSERMYRHSIAVGEDNPGVRYLLALALGAKNRPEAEVVAQFQRALQEQPDYVNALLQIAVVDMRHSRFEDARKKVEECIRYEPANPMLYYNLAMIYQWEKRPRDMRVELERTLRMDPTASGAWRELAQLDLADNQWDAAREKYEKMIAIDPWNASAYTELGNLLANSANLSEASKRLNRALWIDPTNVGARQSLAVVTQQLAAASRR